MILAVTLGHNANFFRRSAIKFYHTKSQSHQEELESFFVASCLCVSYCNASRKRDGQKLRIL